ncbi:hypothetical protein IFR04_013467, partial [Cadophora malorum]
HKLSYLNGFHNTFATLRPHTAAVDAFIPRTTDGKEDALENPTEMILPVKTPDTAIMMLLQVLHQERTIDDLDTSLRVSLESLTRMPGTSACDDLLCMLKSPEQPMMLQIFTSKALMMLRDWQQPNMRLATLAPLPADILARRESR